MKNIRTINVINRLIFISLFFLIFIIFSFNYQNPDNLNYKILYYANANNNSLYLQYFYEIEFFFQVLIQISNEISLSYEGFRIFIYITSMFLLFRASKIYNSYFPLVFFLYFSYSLFIDIIQLRHLLAQSIIVYSIFKLLTNGKIYQFIMGVIIATLIQSFSVIYLPLFILKNNSKNLTKILSIISLLAIVVAIVLYFIRIEFRLLFNLTYLSTKTSIFTVIFGVFLSLSNIFFVKRLNKGKNYNFILNFNYLYVIVIIFISYNVEILRFYRIISLVNIIYISNNFNFKNNRLSMLNYYFYHLLFFGFIYNIYVYWDTVFQDLINYNSFISYNLLSNIYFLIFLIIIFLINKFTLINFRKI